MLSDEERKSHLEQIRNAIRTIPNFPKEGIIFRDVFGIFKNPTLTQYLFTELESIVRENIPPDLKINAVVCPDARGFLFGPTLAVYLNCAFVPARKAGKLPGHCHSVTYDLEYGTATLEMQSDALKPNDHVILVDDLLATGGSLKACVDLIRLAKANPVSAVTVIELNSLNGRAKLEGAQIAVYSVFRF